MSRAAVAGAFAAVVAAGIALGAMLARQRGVAPAPEPARPAPAVGEPAGKALEEEQKRLRRELADALAKSARLERELAESKRKERLPPAKEEGETLAKLLQDFDGLAENALAMMGKPELRALIRKLKAAGPAAVEELARRLLEGKTTGERFLAGLVLEGIGDPAAIPALAKSLQGETDDLVRRMSSHALAMIGTKDSLGPLGEAMSGDADWGVRVNAAYGAATLGDEGAVKLLLRQYAAEDTPAPYRPAVLQAMAMVAHASYAPTFRQILATSRDMTSLLLSIGGLEKMKDASAIPDLERVAGGDYPATVREAAAKAAKKIRE